MALTDLSCKSAKYDGKPKKLADGGGLYLYLSSSGLKLWRMKYRFMNKEKVLSFGQYPNVSLLDARKKRDEAKDMLKTNIDPSLAKHQLKQQARLDHGNTFEIVAREFIEEDKGNCSPETAQDKLTRLERYLFPQIGNMAIKDVTPRILLAALKKIKSQGRHEVTKRIQQTCNQVFFYAVRNEICTTNPMQALKGVIKPQRVTHHPTIESKELPQFLYELAQNKARLYPQTILAVKMMMLTFVRTSELIEAKWPEIDFENKEWRIPAERMKIKNSYDYYSDTYCAPAQTVPVVVTYPMNNNSSGSFMPPTAVQMKVCQDIANQARGQGAPIDTTYFIDYSTSQFDCAAEDPNVGQAGEYDFVYHIL